MIELSEGQSLRVHCVFTHRGAAYSGAKIHAAIGNRSTLWGFDEIVSGNSQPLSFPYAATARQYGEDVILGPIKVGTLFGAIRLGTYEIEVKLTDIPGADIFWIGPNEDIVIVEAPVAPAEFANLTVSYSKV